MGTTHPHGTVYLPPCAQTAHHKWKRALYSQERMARARPGPAVIMATAGAEFVLKQLLSHFFFFF